MTRSTTTKPAAPRALALGALVLVVAACQLPRGTRPATEEERLAYGEALAPLPQDPTTARDRLEAFVTAHGDGALADDAGEKLAAIELGEGRTAEAVRWLVWVVEQHPQGDRAEAARLSLATLARSRGDVAEAQRWLADARFSRMDASQRVVGYRMLADLESRPAEKLRWLGELYAAQTSVDGRKRVDAELDPLVAQLSVDEMATLASSLGKRVPAARLRLRIAERALDAADVDRAERELARVDSLERTERDDALRAEVARRASLRERIATAGVLPTFREVASLPAPRTDGAEGTIGVVLPLTGAFARYGEESLRGVLLAAGVFDDIESARAAADEAGEGEVRPPRGESWRARRASRVRVVVRDSAGQPDRAARAVHELAADPSVAAIVGPLLAAEADAAAAAAQAESIPLLALTSRADVSAGRDFVFRLRTTPADEVRFLVDYAVDELDARRFAVLYPDDTYGRGMRSYFWDAVEARGGYVVAASSYDPSSTDFAEPIRRMIGFTLLTPAEQAAVRDRDAALDRLRRLPREEAGRARRELLRTTGPEGEALPPIVDFDALFIPDTSEKIVMIAPQLAFHDVTGVRLLGTSAWVDPKLVSLGREHVRNAVMASLFHAESSYTFVSDFVDGYSAHFGAVPDVFAASAFDAANLVLVQLAAGHTSRDAVRDGVGSVHGYPGASGITTFLHDGNARKRPFLLGVDGRRIVPLD
ncbi:MAG: penicillin-binding protein activator [Myxococcota bacterium]